MNLVRTFSRIVLSKGRAFGFANFKRGYNNVADVPNLIGQLRARIKVMGPLTVADYMKEVLINPTAGYYQHKSIFGAKGDFVTSPEISQMFGELITVWFLVEWQKIGSPPFQIIELGPGNGSLMQDIVKVITCFSLHKDISVQLVEVSQRLATVQANTLGVKLLPEHSTPTSSAYQTGFTSSGVPVSWYNRVEDVPQKFSFIVANEFFDALPIHKFERTSEGWREILVDIDPMNENSLRFVQSRCATPASIFIKPDEKRNHLEISVASAAIVEHLATRVEEDGGIILLADYGNDGSDADTFRAFHEHKLHDPLVNPGCADLTADVDFSLIRDQAQSKLITFGPVSQRNFLERLGIQVRLQALMEKCEEKEKSFLQNAYHMLVDEDKMGERFKFFAMFPAVLSDYLTKFPVSGFT